MSLEYLNPWRDYIIEKIKQEIYQVASKEAKYNKEKLDLNYLRNFQKSFVLTPVDKAAKNIGVICKKYYLEVLKNEISSDNFQTSNSNINDIIKEYTNLLKIKYNYLHTTIPRELPLIYWISKFHKEPVGTRFITSGRNTVINELSKYVGIGLKHLLKIKKSQCRFLQRCNQTNKFYIIEDNIDIIKYMNENNLFNNDSKYIKTFDLLIN